MEISAFPLAGFNAFAAQHITKAGAYPDAGAHYGQLPGADTKAHKASSCFFAPVLLGYYLATPGMRASALAAKP